MGLIFFQGENRAPNITHHFPRNDFGSYIFFRVETRCEKYTSETSKQIFVSIILNWWQGFNHFFKFWVPSSKLT